jgi:hypothetical protein
LQRLPAPGPGPVQPQALAPRPNRTGLPERLKAGTESLYNSFQPAQMQALAYTQGTDAHVAPGQAKHLQAKLIVGQPNDAYEQEADRVASQVVEQIQAPVPAQSSQGQPVQRQATPDEEFQTKPESTAFQREEELEKHLQTQREQLQRDEIEEEPDVQPQRTQPEQIAGGAASAELESAINSAKGSGQPLDAALQRQMGQAIGADFSGVKVHVDATADRLNQSIQAKAFTMGQDIFFGGGAYNPWSRDGQELIAHELTHVVQQKRGGPTAKKKDSGPPRNHRAEVEYTREEHCVQRKFGFELEMKIPYGKQNASGTGISEVTNGKAEQVEHESGTFKIVGDKDTGGRKQGQKNISSIVELVTTPIDESQLNTADAVSKRFEPLVNTGRALAAMAKETQDKKLSEFNGFGTDNNHWICPTRAAFDMRDDAYVQGTYGLNMAGLGGFIKGIAERNKSNLNAQAIVSGINESFITKEEVESAISGVAGTGPSAMADIKAGPMAGYLTYIATMITSGRAGVVSSVDIAKNIVPLLNEAAVAAPAPPAPPAPEPPKKKQGDVSSVDIAKNIVPLLNKAAVAAPALGPHEVRQALRKLLMARCKVDENTVLFKAGGKTFQTTVSKLLDSVLPLNGAAKWKTLLGEEWVSNEEKPDSPKRDVIFEERRIFPEASRGMRLKIDDWIPVITEYWKMLKIANNTGNN